MQGFVSFVLLFALIGSGQCNPAEKGFLKYGDEYGDICFSGRCRSDTSRMLELNAQYWFYGKNYTNIFICKDGALLFDDIFCNSNDPNITRIVGYWGNITLTDSMTVYYDERDETENINEKFKNSISTVQDYLHCLYQPGESEFVPTHIFLATWPCIDVDGGKNVTFQMVLATRNDTKLTYAIFIYENGWNISRDQEDQIGFHAGDERKRFLPSDDNYANGSNIGIPGVYAYRIDEENIHEPVRIRLVEINETSGLVNVCHAGEWRSVCDDYWTDRDANVACNQSGFLPFGASVIRRGEFESEVNYWLDDVHCEGNEQSLFDCPRGRRGDKPTGDHNCGRKERAGVHCITKEDIKIRLQPNETNDDEMWGIIELWYKYEWRSVGINHWTNDDAMVACKELGFNKGEVAFEEEDDEVKYWMDHVNCNGNEEYLFACQYVIRQPDKNDQKWRAGVKCRSPQEK